MDKHNKRESLSVPSILQLVLLYLCIDFYRISTQEPQSLAPDTSSSYPRQSAKAHTIKETDTTSKEPTGTGMSATVTTSELTSGVTYLTIAARVAKSNITVISDSLLPIQNTDRFPLQRITARGKLIS